MNVIKIDFSLFGRKIELVISMTTSIAANSIGESTIHTTLKVNSKVNKNYQCKISA